MARVRYAKSPRDLEDATETRRDADEGHVRLLRCRYETDPEAIAAVVPRPLEAVAASEVEVLVAACSRGDAVHHVALIGARVDYDGTPGVMPIAMPCDLASEVIRGRERFGEPRKQARLSFEVEGDHVIARVERCEIVFLRIGGRREGKVGASAGIETSFSFKAFPAADPAKDFDHDPQLIRSDWRFVPTTAWRLVGDLELGESACDPVADLPVRRLIDLEYAEGRYSRESRVLRPVPGDWLLPFLHQRDDAPWITGVDV